MNREDGSRKKKATATSVEWLRVTEHQNGRNTKLRNALSNTPLFQDLPRSAWRELAGLFHLRYFKEGEVIFEEGTPGLGMYIIIDGEVEIIMREKGETTVLSELGTGDFFGEMSLIEDTPRNATAIATCPTQLIGIFRPQLLQLIHGRPRLGVILIERLARIVARRLREADRLLNDCHRKLAAESGE